MDRKLIIIVFYIPVQGLSRQQAEKQIYDLMEAYHPDLPEDMNEKYHIEHLWFPTKAEEPKVELIYPPKFQLDKEVIADITDIDKLIQKLEEFKKEFTS